MTYTVALLNMKGGVGKTTLAVNLAWYSYRWLNKKVLLVDLDPQFNATQYLMNHEQYKQHAKDNGTIADLLIETPRLTLRRRQRSKPSLKKCVAHIHVKTTAQFDLLPSQLALSHVVKNPAQMDYKLEKLLAPVRDEYDLVFIDCAPTDSVLTTMTLSASDFLLIPIRPDRFSILGFGMVLETISNFRDNCHDPHGVQNLGVAFTQVTKSRVDAQCMAEIRRAAGRRTYVFAAQLPYSPTFARAIQQQTPAFETKYARKELKASIASLVTEMYQQIDEVPNGKVVT